MQEIRTFNEKRAEIYWWLSSLFAKELTDKDLAQYQTPQIRSFLTGLGENSTLKPSIDKFVDALNRLLDREDAQLELSADFCDLFLKSDKDSALPYASMYIGKSGLLNDTPAKDVAELMAKHGVAVEESLNEPADHLAVELDFLGNLIIRSNELEQEKHLDEALIEQQQFINKYLLSWTPQFNEKCQQLDEFGFYSSVSELLCAFLELDCRYLLGE
ncbi:molecular chaperone TorD [Vibrio sp. ZSDE26]|uniref:Chaperone protein TorD n=1 Tax=Vibrio amylolyticus TaxID=2847292 RepID=A0A9X1XFG1_9VIBR|nr:molecular chaperone TorD [Vibrio amylolyticus]MCK6261959.1 molecular chaperone TorD [Vibrio amylolyticus]